MKIIPAIDIIDGKCVRLTQGNYASQKVYNSNPLEVAKNFEELGCKYLHLVDLDGAKLKKVTNINILHKIACSTSLLIDYSGGITKSEDLEKAFDFGANQVCIGSIAIQNPDLFIVWLNKFGNNKIILSADIIENKISINGWTKQTDVFIKDLIQKYEKFGLKNVICTDISNDGMLNGVSASNYKDILQNTNIDLIASGGVASLKDIKQLKEIGCKGVVIGKAIYENKINLKEAIEIC